MCDWPIRLQGGSNQYEGRVEIMYNNTSTWGTICDDFWDIKAADVVYSMFRFGDASMAWNESHFGGGSGPIWLDDVFCLGSESTVYECAHSGGRIHNCKHTEDVGVTCSSKCLTVVCVCMCTCY